jgi:hypothetical protein
MTDSAPHLSDVLPARRRAPVALAIRALGEQRAPVWAALPFILGSFLVGPFVGWPGPVGVIFWMIQGAFAGCVAVCWVLIRERFRSDLKPRDAREAYSVAWLRARAAWLANDRLAAYAVILILLPLVIGCYTGWKTWLGTELPFRWDATLARSDRVLHFGHDPWRLLQPLLGREWATDTLSILYESGWAATLQGVITWQALQRPSQQRTRFFVAVVIAWPLIGNLAAAAFMSAGPCYYGRVVSGPDPYRDLISYVQGANRLTSALQAYLWRAHETRQLDVIGGGISAMPSMHLVMATLAAIPVWRLARFGRSVAILLVSVTLVGSIHLGWHYALDGYAGIVGAGVLWLVAWPIARATDTAVATGRR